jgi:glycosyltransferase involved in cell wall biosynthesis
MRVCIDLSPAVHRRAGIGRYARDLAGALLAEPGADSLVGFYNDPTGRLAPEPPLDMLPRLTVRRATKPWRLTVALADLLHRPQDHLVPGVDVFHATDHLLPYFGRLGPRTVATLHDLAFLVDPAVHKRSNRLFLAAMVPRFLRRADAVICVSSYTARDATRLLGLDPARLTVVPSGVDARFRPPGPAAVAETRARLGLPERYLLYVGTVEPRKNLPTLLRAYAALRRHGESPRLVIAGRLGWLTGGFFEALRALDLESEVTQLGYVADADLPALYAGAEAFAFPSSYEGFGFPVLEAMACGTPVVCSNASSLPEVAGDAALYHDPTDADALADALARVLTRTDLRDELRARGLARAAEFTWARAAKETRAVYDRLRR